MQPNFESALEADIERLSAEIKSHREYPEMQGASSQEILKKSIQSMGPLTSSPRSDSGQAGQATDVFQNPLPDYAANAPAETKLEIEHLLEKAFREGIVKANAEASKSNAFVLDAFHDALVGKLYPELKRRGILE